MTRRFVVLLALVLAAALAPARPASAHHFASFTWSASAMGTGYSGTALGLFHDPGSCAITWHSSGSTGSMQCNGSVVTGMPIAISCSVVFATGVISGSCTGAVSGALTGFGSPTSGSATID